MLLINVMMGSVGQILIKKGADKLHAVHAAQGFLASMFNSFKGIFTPLVFLGFCVYAVSSVLWIRILSTPGMKLSFAYPTISLSYVVVVILSAVFLGDRVPWIAVAGLLLICGGVSLIGIGYGAIK
jgi:multidrug transporter EmrE-like cation transporter